MRILSVHPVATEVIFALGAGNMLVGRTDACEYPQQALNIPSIGKVDEITPEAIAIFEPTLVLVGPGQENLLSKVKDAWLFAPKSIDELYGTLTSLGEQLDKRIEAGVLVHELRTTLEHVAQQVEKFHSTRVYAEQSVPRLSELFLADLVRIAGGELYRGIATAEQLEKFNPHVIIAIGDQMLLERIASREGWRGLQAIQHERTFLVEEQILRPTPHCAQGAKMLAKLLHGVNGN